MATFQSYPKKPFSSSQNFLARDPAGSGQVIRVQGQDILDAAVAEIEAQGEVVQSKDTVTEAVATDYDSGVYLVVGGNTAVLDGGQAIYRVSDPGSGGIVMDNGNELVLLFQANSGNAGNFDVTTSDDDITSDRVLRTENKWHTAQTGDYFTYGGTANAITLTSVNTTPVTSLVTGQQFRFTPTVTNTGATTINVDGLGVITCKTPTGADLPADYLLANEEARGFYDGTNAVISRRVESGSNANGEFTIYEDGSAECWLDDTGSLAPNVPFNWTYPVPFASGTIPYVNGSVTNRSSNANYYIMSFGTAAADSRTNTDCDAYYTSPSAQNANATLFAKGKWY